MTTAYHGKERDELLYVNGSMFHFVIAILLLIHWNSSWSVSVCATEATADLAIDRASERTVRTRRELRKLAPAIVHPNFYLGAERSLRHDGLRRWFMEHQPASMPTDGTAALLIILHWGQGNMRSSDVFGRVLEKDPWLDLALEQGFLVLAPSATSERPYFKFLGLSTRGLNQDWNDLLVGGALDTGADDVGFISALIDWAATERNIDRSRVYVTGISNGGTMTERLVIERPELFAAAAAFVANLPERDIPFPSVGTPFFLLSGTNDTYFPFNGGPSTKDRGVVRSAEATRDFFVAADHAGPEMVETWLPDLDPTDDCRIRSQYFPHNTTPVQFYLMVGGGHQSPTLRELPLVEKFFLDDRLGNSCHDADGVGLAWAFLSQFPR